MLAAGTLNKVFMFDKVSSVTKSLVEYTFSFYRVVLSSASLAFLTPDMKNALLVL